MNPFGQWSSGLPRSWLHISLPDEPCPCDQSSACRVYVWNLRCPAGVVVGVVGCLFDCVFSTYLWVSKTQKSWQVLNTSGPCHFAFRNSRLMSDQKGSSTVRQDVCSLKPPVDRCTTYLFLLCPNHFWSFCNRNLSERQERPWCFRRTVSGDVEKSIVKFTATLLQWFGRLLQADVGMCSASQ